MSRVEIASAPARPLAGMALMALGVCTLPVMDGLAKYLSAEYHVVQVTWARYLFHLLLLMVLLVGRLSPAELIPRQLGTQILRSACLLATTLCYFGAISFMPLADALALAFTAPLVSTALAPMLLGESVGRRGWLAVMIGFAGTLVVVRPGLGAFHWASLLGLGAGLFYGLYQLATRHLAGSARPLVTLLYTALFGLVVLSAVLPLFWRLPDWRGWSLMLAMGAAGAVGHYLIIRAFEHASASTLSPLNYLEIVVAVSVGWFVFDDFPDQWTWLGIALIAISGLLVVFWRRRDDDVTPAL
jgi:drug/metabolite transporter (DMT)-like permease